MADGKVVKVVLQLENGQYVATLHATGREHQAFSGQVATASEAASGAVNKVTSALQGVASASTSAAGDQFIAGLREQIVVSGKSADELLRYRAAQAGVAAQASPLILQLQNQRAAQQAAAEAARTEEAAQREAAAAKQRSAGQQAAFLAGLREEVALQGKSHIEVLRYRAAQMGVSGGAEQYIQALEAANKAHGRGAISAGQHAAAMRMLPAQMTDIVTSMASGMPIWMVAIQQGGQIKDSFGGAGAALRAMAGAISPAAAGFGSLAGVIGAAGLAYYQGSSEAAEFRRSIVMSGNAAGTSVGQLTDMARAIAQVTGTQGAASAALAQMAGSGAVARDNLQQFAQTAMDLDRYVSVPVKDVVSNLESLAKAPLQASIKLNEQYHYLTEAVYEHIKALDEQGKKDEAGATAQRAYMAAMEARKNEIVANLGSIERGWNAVAGAAKKGWDAILGMGRQASTQQQLDETGAKIAKLHEQLGKDDRPGFSETGGGAAVGAGANVVQARRRAELEMLVQQQAVLQESLRLEQRGAEATAESARKVEARAEWDKVVAANLSKQAKEELEIKNIREKGEAAGKQAFEIEKEITAHKAKNADKGGTKDLERQKSLLAELSGLSSTFYRDWEGLNKQFKAGELTQEQLVKAQEQLLAKQPGIKKAREEEEEALKKSLKVLQAQYAVQQQIADEIAQAEVARTQAVYAGRQAVTDYARGVDEATRLLEIERQTVAGTASQRALAAENLRIELELERQLEAIRTNQGFDQADRDEQAAKARAAAAQARANATSRAELDHVRELRTELQRVTEQYEQGLTNAAMAGGKSLKEYVVGMLRTTAFRIVLDPFVKPLAGILAGATSNGSAAAASQGGGVMGTANLLSSAYSALTTGVSSSITAGFAKLAGSSFGQAIGLSNSTAITGNNPSAFVPAGGQLTSLGQSIGTGLGMVGSGLAGYGISSAISNGYTTGGNTVNVLSGIASAFFGPLAGVVGGLINRAFGRKLKDTGIEGTIGGSAGFEGGSYQFYKGGWFRSDKTVRSDLDAGVDKNLDTAVKQMQLSMAGLATSLGQPTEAISSFSQAIKLSFNGLDEAGIQEKVQEALAGYNEGLASAFISSLDRSELPKWVDRLMGNVDASAVERLQAVAEWPAKLLQSIGTSRAQLAQLYAEGLASGDTAAAGQSVADSLVASIEASMLGNASAQVFDIVNQGIVTPMLDAIVMGQNISEALSEASIQKTIERAKEAAAAFAELWNNAEFTAAMEDIRTTVGSALGNAGAAMDYIPRYTRALNDAADAALRAEDAERKRITALHESARKIVETQQGALDALKRNLQEAAIVQRGGMIGSLAVTAQEAEAAQQFTTALGDATGALAELEALGLSDELSSYTAEIGKIVQETKALLADQVAGSRLLSGNAQGALDALMSASTLAYKDFMGVGGRDGFNAGAFNGAYAKEQALNARALAEQASANALTTQNVREVMGSLSQHMYSDELQRPLYLGIRDAIVEASGTVGTYVVRDAVDAFARTMAGIEAVQSYQPTGPGLASVYAAQRNAGSASAGGWARGTWQIGEQVVAYGQALDRLDGALATGKINQAEYASAVEALTAAAGGAADALVDHALTVEEQAERAANQAAAALAAQWEISRAGLASIDHYFESVSGLTANLAAEASAAAAPIALATEAIGRMKSASAAFGDSARAAISGVSGDDVNSRYALSLLREEGSSIRAALLVASAADIAAQVLTTADAAAMAKQLANSTAFAGMSASGVRDASLLLDGVKAHDAVAFEAAYMRMADALGKGAITEAQYVELANTALRTLADEQAELERHTSQVVAAFDRLRDAARSTADALLVDNNASTLTGAQIAAEAQRQYADVMARLRADPTDSQATSEMAAASKSMLSAVQNVSTAAEYGAIFAETIRDLRVVEATQAPTFQSTTPVLKVPAFDAGVDYLPHDMLALVHQGERIMPAADNRQLMQLLGGAGGGSGGMAEVAALLRDILARLEQLERSNMDGHHANEIANNKSAEALQQIVAEGIRPYEETPQ